MKIDRYELEIHLDEVIKRHNSNKKILVFIKEKMSTRGISLGLIQDIWSKRISLDTVSLPVLYLLCKNLYKITCDKNIIPTNYFTDVEILDGDNYQNEITDGTIKYSREDPLIFDNVIQKPGDETHFVFFMSGREVRNLQDGKVFVYNFDTQRNPKYTTIGDNSDLIKVANVNTESVKEISEQIGNGLFITNTITLNLLNDGTDSFFYDKKSQKLYIYSGQINPVDGFHRMQGIAKALINNPNNNYITEIRLTNWDVQKCRNFIFQEDKRNKIDKRYMSSVIDVNKWGNKVVTKLNESSSDMKGKITTDIRLIRHNKAFTMFDTMSDTVELLYEFKSNMDVIKTEKWLREFFDIIIGYKINEFVSNIGETKKHSVIAYPLIFVGYLTISKFLQGVDDWEYKLMRMLDIMDWNVENPVWNELNICKKLRELEYVPIITTKPSYLKKIINYFEKVVYINENV